MITDSINGIELTFETDNSVFSPESFDKGTLAMLSTVEFSRDDKVLDLGCGYGLVGIYIAKLIGDSNVFMSDNDLKCVELTGKNAHINGVSKIRVIYSDGFKNFDDNDFTLILSNPPYHSDFSVAKHFIEKGFNRLQIGGKMIMVTKRKSWYKKKFVSIFGGVKIDEINGYFVFTAEKRNSQYGMK